NRVAVRRAGPPPPVQHTGPKRNAWPILRDVAFGGSVWGRRRVEIEQSQACHLILMSLAQRGASKDGPRTQAHSLPAKFSGDCMMLKALLTSATVAATLIATGAQAQEELKIGVLVTLSGAGATWGNAMKGAAEMAAEDINKEG